jgi:hypothetical protein
MIALRVSAGFPWAEATTRKMTYWAATIRHTLEVPLFLSSLPLVMGRTTPAFRLAAGLDRLFGGSPVETCTV